MKSKKLICAVLAALMLLCSTTTAFASPIPNGNWAALLEHNHNMSCKVGFSGFFGWLQEAKIELGLRLVENANDEIAEEIAKAQSSKNPNTEFVIRYLQWKTESISTAAARIVAPLGIDVECEWIEVEIRGQVVLVDPLRVVNVRR